MKLVLALLKSQEASKFFVNDPKSYKALEGKSGRNKESNII